ncbi:uncharacterized protein LOC126737596 [Anthonomus grandis grandis]|uniref:uncharacterized protein LOC126737596 n=1 Tax=Anthonomus grandis grandis TaxID=2921223 RepID=UPI002165881B|nr:uncharacterized protein LOC126737596 [Anthonomus grandis grandis]
MYSLPVIVLFTVVLQVSCDSNFSSIVDVASLSTLPLDALLNIKKNVLSITTDAPRVNDSKTTDSLLKGTPEALPYNAQSGFQKKGDNFYLQYEEEEKYHEKKKSITKIFQLSVITLAFLAFGGYLLFLVIAAIREKQDYYNMNPNITQVMAAMVNSELTKRRRKKKKPIKGDSAFGYKEEESMEKLYPSKMKRNFEQHIDVEEMYQVLVNLCEGYTKFAGYHQKS